MAGADFVNVSVSVEKGSEVVKTFDTSISSIQGGIIGAGRTYPLEPAVRRAWQANRERNLNVGLARWLANSDGAAHAWAGLQPASSRPESLANPSPATKTESGLGIEKFRGLRVLREDRIVRDLVGTFSEAGYVGFGLPAMGIRSRESDEGQTLEPRA